MKKISMLITCLMVIKSFAQTQIDSSDKWSYHFQLTAIDQTHPAFKAAYSGNNSLMNSAENKKVSLTSTLFLGRKLWRNATVYFNPEIAGGSGISSAKGIAGFTNGETFRIGSADPKIYIARLYLNQIIPLKNTAYEKAEDDANQVEENMPTSRVSITVGKICLSDFFDNNSYSHDPRSQFMNWSLMSNAAWDYPADTRGYTQGLVAQFIKPDWAIRFSSVLVPRKANGLQLDYNISKAHSETLEFEKSWKQKRKGTVRILVFHTVSQSPRYSSTLTQIKNGDSSSIDVYSGQKEWKQYGGVKYGIGINVEQEISKSMAAFLKASWNDGKTATWAFTEIDRSMSAGLSIGGSLWRRSHDHLGLAQVVNAISPDHQEFLKAGLYGFIIGDGKLNYGLEAITECYYQAQLSNSFFLSFDYQFVQNPAYNKDRGPVHVFALRGHIEF